jgi:hypothetical protein
VLDYIRKVVERAKVQSWSATTGGPHQTVPSAVAVKPAVV